MSRVGDGHDAAVVVVDFVVRVRLHERVTTRVSAAAAPVTVVIRVVVVVVVVVVMGL